VNIPASEKEPISISLARVVGRIMEHPQLEITFVLIGEDVK